MKPSEREEILVRLDRLVESCRRVLRRLEGSLEEAQASLQQTKTKEEDAATE